MLLAFHMSRSSIKGGSPWAQGELSAKLTEGIQMSHGLEHLKNAMYNPLRPSGPAPLYSKGSLWRARASASRKAEVHAQLLRLLRQQLCELLIGRGDGGGDIHVVDKAFIGPFA